MWRKWRDFLEYEEIDCVINAMSGAQRQPCCKVEPLELLHLHK
jgi:hypothetical protein